MQFSNQLQSSSHDLSSASDLALATTSFLRHHCSDSDKKKLHDYAIDVAKLHDIALESLLKGEERESD